MLHRHEVNRICYIPKVDRTGYTIGRNYGHAQARPKRGNAEAYGTDEAIHAWHMTE